MRSNSAKQKLQAAPSPTPRGVESSAAAKASAKRASASQESDAPSESTPRLASPLVIQADVDGRRVRLSALDEVIIECGKASITLRRNGKVIIRGTQVETNSEGTNRIKGGQVRIN